MLKKRYYLDTSVWVGPFDPRVKFETMMFFNMVHKNKYVCLYSDVVEREMVNRSKDVQNFFKFWPDELKEKLEITPEILKLASTYIEQKVVGDTNFDDCTHVAVATVHKVDALVSCNLKHIVKEKRARDYNSVNMGFGYPILDILSPAKAVDYE